jgi:hypothetical protein
LKFITGDEPWVYKYNHAIKWQSITAAPEESQISTRQCEEHAGCRFLGLCTFHRDKLWPSIHTHSVTSVVRFVAKMFWEVTKWRSDSPWQQGSCSSALFVQELLNNNGMTVAPNAPHSPHIAPSNN